MKANTIYCECSSKEHQVAFSYEKETNSVYCTIHLKKLSFLKRIKEGFKYIFGHESKYGHFEEFVIGKSNVTDIKNELRKINCKCNNCSCEKKS